MKVFFCQRCGECCKGESTVGLSPEERERIARFLGLSLQEFMESFTEVKGEERVEMKTKDGYCIFYDQTKRLCAIHPVKPDKCKEWPFPEIIFKDETNFQIIKASCKGLEKFSFTDIQQIKNLTK